MVSLQFSTGRCGSNCSHNHNLQNIYSLSSYVANYFSIKHNILNADIYQSYLYINAVSTQQNTHFRPELRQLHAQQHYSRCLQQSRILHEFSSHTFSSHEIITHSVVTQSFEQQGSHFTKCMIRLQRKWVAAIYMYLYINHQYLYSNNGAQSSSRRQRAQRSMYAVFSTQVLKIVLPPRVLTIFQHSKHYISFSNTISSPRSLTIVTTIVLLSTTNLFNSHKYYFILSWIW